jgi:autotransporter-associated beta strand protein
MRKSVGLAVVAGAAGVFLSSAVQAAVVGQWITGTGNWSDSAKWQGGVIPNGQGDSAIFTTGSSSTTTVDVAGGVTLGTLKVDGVGNASWQITPTANSVFLNQDGAGPLSASIVNNIQLSGAGTNPSIFLNPASTGSGTFVLQDDLLISNTSNSTRTNGAVQVRGLINGTGNIRIENVSNNFAVGQVAITSGGAGNSYGGNTTIAKGATTFNRGDSFSPTPNNTVIIGAAGMGAATLMFVGGGVGNMENQFASAAGAGGPLVFGLSGTQTGDVTIRPSSRTSTFTLNGDLNFSNPNATQLFTIGTPIAGIGKLIKVGAGAMRVTDINTSSGGTVVEGGSLAVGHFNLFNNGFGEYPATDGTLGSGDVTVNSTAVRLEIESGMPANSVIGDLATVSLAGGGTAGTADFGYTLLGAGVNETVGMLLLNGIAQEIGTYGSTTSGATFQNDEFFSGPGVLNVTLVPEPAAMSLIGFAAAGLLGRRRRRN